LGDRAMGATRELGAGKPGPGEQGDGSVTLPNEGGLSPANLRLDLKLESKTALQKVSELEKKDLIGAELAKMLRTKMDQDGSGLMSKVSPHEVLEAMKGIEALQEKGFSQAAIRAAATIGFARGGAKGMVDYLTEVQSINPNDYKSYAQQNNALSIVWFNDNYTGVFDEEQSTFLDIPSITARARSTTQFIYSDEMAGLYGEDGVRPQINHGSLSRWDDILRFISSGEGGYNSMNQGTSAGRIVGSTHNASSILGKNLTNMTIGEVMALQASGRLFAAGRYQIIPSTMKEALKYSGLSAQDSFSPENQDKLGIALILHKRPYLGKYLFGQHNDLRGAMKEAALEWASLPDPNTGRSAYGGGNAAHVTVQRVADALQRARAVLSGGSSNA
jgi:hypothetical protein